VNDPATAQERASLVEADSGPRAEDRSGYTSRRGETQSLLASPPAMACGWCALADLLSTAHRRFEAWFRRIWNTLSRPMSYGYQQEIVSQWFARGQETAVTFDRFIYVWIAFNAALSARYGRIGDGAKVGRFADEFAVVWPDWLAEDALLRPAVTDFVQLSPIRDDPPPVVGEQRETVVRADDGKSVIAGIYAVRNNLFHGAKQFDAVRDHALVKTSSRLLERIIIDTGLLAMAQPNRSLGEPLALPGGESAASTGG
jgi:hypothetical protein